MDELFRRAGEHYPLDTSGADWNKVMNALQDSGAKKEVAGKSKRRFLWLLLLLPLGFLCNRLYSPGVSNDHQVSKIKEQQPGNKTSNVSEAPSAETTVSSQLHSIQSPVVDNNKIDNNKETTTSFQSSHQTAIRSTTIGKTDVTAKTNVKTRSGKTNRNIDQNASGNSGFTISQPGIKEQTNATYESTIASSYTSLIPIDYRVRRGLLKPAYSAEKDFLPVGNPNKENKKNIAATTTKKFYVGAFGGMDATTVKFQKVEDKGSNYGFLAGYQFNAKWAFEAGIFWERKYYYSQGKYFNLKGMYLPPNTSVTEVSGNCKMIELPVNVKYNFSMNWYGKAGLASYLMKNEDYKYVYYYGNSGTYADHYKNYATNSTSLFSHITIAGGYEHKLGRLAEIRVEPYLKIPVRKMGVGDLPLFSSGVHLGLIKRF